VVGDRFALSQTSNKPEHLGHSSFIIAKRSLSLSKTYVVISGFLSIMAIILGNLGQVLEGPETLPSQLANSTQVQLAPALPLISIPLMVFSTLTFTTPVILLYVYDKNNGVLEYFLSLGMNQSDVYKDYLKAALLLSSIMLGYEILASLGIGLLLGTSTLTLTEIVLLAPAIGFPAVSFVTIAMMAFSSLQKQRVGSNQPLGIGFGVIMVLPTYFIPIIAPAFVLIGDLIVAGVVAVVFLSLFFLSSKLIRREKLLP
jgi:hypothetical protein